MIGYLSFILRESIKKRIEAILNAVITQSFEIKQLTKETIFTKSVIHY